MLNQYQCYISQCLCKKNLCYWHFNNDQICCQELLRTPPGKNAGLCPARTMPVISLVPGGVQAPLNNYIGEIWLQWVWRGGGASGLTINGTGCTITVQLYYLQLLCVIIMTFNVLVYPDFQIQFQGLLPGKSRFMRRIHFYSPVDRIISTVSLSHNGPWVRFHYF